MADLVATIVIVEGKEMKNMYAKFGVVGRYLIPLFKEWYAPTMLLGCTHTPDLNTPNTHPYTLLIHHLPFSIF